jgi:hypothetical protein
MLFELLLYLADALVKLAALQRDVAEQMYLFTRTGLTASVLPGWDNLSSRCTP